MGMMIVKYKSELFEAVAPTVSYEVSLAVI